MTHNRQGISFREPTNKSHILASATRWLQLPGGWLTHCNLTCAGLLPQLPPLKGLCCLFPNATGRTEGPLLLLLFKSSTKFGEQGSEKKTSFCTFQGGPGPMTQWEIKPRAAHGTLSVRHCSLRIASTSNCKIAGKERGSQALHKTAFIFLLGKLF